MANKQKDERRTKNEWNRPRNSVSVLNPLLRAPTIPIHKEQDIKPAYYPADAKCNKLVDLKAIRTFAEHSS